MSRDEFERAFELFDALCDLGPEARRVRRISEVAGSADKMPGNTRTGARSIPDS